MPAACLEGGSAGRIGFDREAHGHGCDAWVGPNAINMLRWLAKRHPATSWWRSSNCAKNWVDTHRRWHTPPTQKPGNSNAHQRQNLAPKAGALPDYATPIDTRHGHDAFGLISRQHPMIDQLVTGR